MSRGQLCYVIAVVCFILGTVVALAPAVSPALAPLPFLFIGLAFFAGGHVIT